MVLLLIILLKIDRAYAEELDTEGDFINLSNSILVLGVKLRNLSRYHNTRGSEFRINLRLR